MRKRDIAILLLTIIGILVSFQQEGALSIRRGFRVTIYDESSRMHVLPPPLIADLDGDGKNEVILLTSRETLAIVQPTLIRRSHFEFTELFSKREAPFPASCIGFATGYVQKYDSKSKAPRKQIIVAVTDDYMVYAYDHLLNPLWTDHLPDQDETIFIPTHASILILPHDIHKDDQGMVVIGVDTQKQLLDEPPETMAQPNAVHFSYYGLNAKDGEVRWKHDAGSFHDYDVTKVYPQQSYKLTAKHLEHHSGEQDWTVYRRSMMAVFPHSYNHPHDTLLRVHHFSKKLRTIDVASPSYTGVKSNKPNAAVPAISPLKAIPERTHIVNSRSKRVVKPTDDSYGELGDRLSGISGLVKERMAKPHSHEEHIKHPNVFVAHMAEGIEVIHLYTGRTLCQFGPLAPGKVYDDVNGDTSIDEIGVHYDHRHNPLAPNQPKSQCIATILTGSPGMAKESLFNGTICSKGGMLRHFQMLKHLLREGEHTSEDEDFVGEFEAPVRDPLHKQEAVKAAPPLVLHKRVSAAKGLRKVRSNVLFFINTGLVSCVDPNTRRIVWQMETDSTFHSQFDAAEGPQNVENIDDYAGMSLRGTNPHDQELYRHFPHMIPFAVPATHSSMKRRTVKDARTVATVKDKPYVLVFGDGVLTALRAEDGKVEEAIDLDEPPVAPVVLGDFNSDGTTDIVITSRNAYYGYLTYQQGGTNVVTFLMLALIGLLAILLVSVRCAQFADPYFDTAACLGKRSTD